MFKTIAYEYKNLNRRKEATHKTYAEAREWIDTTREFCRGFDVFFIFKGYDLIYAWDQGSVWNANNETIEGAK